MLLGCTKSGWREGQTDRNTEELARFACNSHRHDCFVAHCHCLAARWTGTAALLHCHSPSLKSDLRGGAGMAYTNKTKKGRHTTYLNFPHIGFFQTMLLGKLKAQLLIIVLHGGAG